MNKIRKNSKAGAELLSRRSLIGGALAGTAAIPLLQAHRAKGQSAEKPPTRLVVFATPNGTRNDLFWPTDNGGGSLTFPQYTQPLSGYADKLLFLDGIRHCQAVVGDNGFNGGLNGSEHARGTGGLLTARPLGAGTFRSFMATSGWGSGISIDQHLANVLDPPTRFKTLELGIHVRDSQVRGRISYTGADQPVPPREDPADVFDALFGGEPVGAGGGTDPALAQLRAERKRVFDLSKEEIKRLQARLGAEDRIKLQAHFDAIESIEDRLSAATQDGVGIDQCNVPQGSMAVDILDDGTMEDTGRLQMDLAAAALACDQTRIITIQWNYAESEHLFPFLNITGNHHDISHDWQGAGFEKYGVIHAWFAEQLAYFLGKLDSYQEGEGTLLDNTVVFWGSEIGESTSHDLTRMPYVLAGGGGGVLNTGRVLDFKSSPRDNNQLLVSLAHMMGAEEITEFGDASGATGPLPDLLL
jgi:hypothetical protein